MNAWPHGVIVVPTVPTTASQYALVSAPCGMISDVAARPQSGWASTADAMYASDTPTPTATNAYCTRLKLPAVISSTTATAEMAALTGTGTPNRSRAAPIPANSATVVPRFATSIVTAANVAHRTPKRSRISPVMPWPVARPSRAPTSCVKNSTTWLARITQRSS